MPNDVPLIRASVTRTMSVTPAAASFAGIGIIPHSGIPGTPTGPAPANTSTVSAATGRSGSSIRARISSYEWKTSAGPRWENRCGEAADVLRTAPLGARVPVTTANAPSACSGSAGSRRAPPVATSEGSSSRQGRPVAVIAAVSILSPSSRMRAGTPPAA